MGWSQSLEVPFLGMWQRQGHQVTLPSCEVSLVTAKKAMWVDVGPFPNPGSGWEAQPSPKAHIPVPGQTFPGQVIFQS